MLTIAKFDRYDMVNNPLDDTASFTIWFSGCNLRCKNCHNRTLWDKNYGRKYSVDSVKKIVLATCNKLNIKSVVLLGGEPLQQDTEELLSLCQSIKEAGIKIWLYTGYDFDDIPQDILDCVYTIKCGRYIDKLKQDGFPASSNQKVYRWSSDHFIDITSNLGGNRQCK